MKPFDAGCLPESDVYFYTATSQARETFFYPLCAGHYYCTPGYYVSRTNYDSYLLIYAKRGSGCLEAEGETFPFHEGQALLVDCYKPHTYYATGDLEIFWVHFDGATSRQYLSLIYQNLGHVADMKNLLAFEKLLDKLISMLSSSNVSEPLCSKCLVQLLTEILISQDVSSKDSYSSIIEDTIAFISNNIAGQLSLEELSGRVGLSPYYFTRLFKQETGYTPHEYVIHARINIAKFYLKSSAFPIKEICYNSGFSSESSFCSTFKKICGVTPTKYRYNQNVR